VTASEIILPLEVATVVILLVLSITVVVGVTTFSPLGQYGLFCFYFSTFKSSSRLDNHEFSVRFKHCSEIQGVSDIRSEGMSKVLTTKFLRLVKINNAHFPRLFFPVLTTFLEEKRISCTILVWLRFGPFRGNLERIVVTGVIVSNPVVV